MSHIRSPEWDSPLSIQQERRRRLKGGTALEIPHSSAAAVGVGAGGCCSDHMVPANNRLGGWVRDKGGRESPVARGGCFMAEMKGCY